MLLIGVAIGLLLILSALGIAAAPYPWRRIVVYGGTALVCALIAFLSLARLGGSVLGADILVLPVGLPWLSAHLRVDALAAFFLFVVNLIGMAAAVYGIDYDRAEEKHQHDAPPGPVVPLFPLFLAGMNMVVVADDAFVFLVAWEFMSLASWLLVLSSHRQPETPRAALVYMVMASFGTLALLLGFGALAGVQGDYSFDAIRAQTLGPAQATLAVMLVLVGAGSKAGLVPLHVWLPLAHPAAPSHVSALMSGVMTKVALYAIVRVLFDLVSEPVVWWGGLIMALGALSAVIGVLYALMQNDLKTLLAYSTVENVGVIVIGIGLALAFQANGFHSLAALSLTAALLHVLNHAIFKSLLFFGAGAVLVATGERDMGRLGGLIHRMPVTAATFLIGCVAISALPPLNGFVSEWLAFQAIISGAQLPQWSLKIAVPVIGALLALSAALATACFVKAYGITFLGQPRSAPATTAVEIGPGMGLSMSALAGACVLIGIVPSLALSRLSGVVESLVGAAPFAADASSWMWLTPVEGRASSYSGVIVVGVIGALSMLLVYGIHRFASNTVRRSIPWGCGFDQNPGPIAQYSPDSFAQPIRRVFGSVVFGAREEVDMPEPGEVRPARLTVILRDPAWDFIYGPIVRGTEWLTDRINFLQSMTIRRHLTLMFAVLVLLMVVVAVSQ